MAGDNWPSGMAIQANFAARKIAGKTPTAAGRGLRSLAGQPFTAPCPALPMPSRQALG